METQDDNLIETQKIHDVASDLTGNSNSTQLIDEQEGKIKEPTDDSISFSLHHQNTSNTNEPGETPFLNKLVDPFGESPSQHLITPLSKSRNGIKRDFLGSLMRNKNPSDMFQKIRLRQQQVPMIDYESQSQIQGILIGDEDEDEEMETQEVDDTFKFDDDRITNHRPVVADTQVIGDNTQVVNELGDTQVIPSGGDIINDTFEIPATQLIRRSIEVPSTVEKKQHLDRHDVFDEIISQKSESDSNEENGGSLNISKSNKTVIGSDEEMENTTAMYDLIEIDTEPEEEEEEDSIKYQFPEDSLKVYDQLKLKRRQFSDVQLKKKPRLTRTRTEFDTPSKTNSSSSWLGNKREKLKSLSSPSTEIPNSSPSMIQLTNAKLTNMIIQSSPTTQQQQQQQPQQQLQDSRNDVVIEPASNFAEIISSRERSFIDNDDNNNNNDDTSPMAIDTLSQRPSTQDSSLTDLGDEVYRNTNDELTRVDIKYYSSVWARTGDKFHPTMIKKVLSDGFLIIHQGKIVNLQGSLNVFPLDIKIGDRIKIYNRKKIHCVTGLSMEIESDDKIKCIRGFDTVYAMPLVKNAIDHVNDVEEKFPMSQIYLVNSIWMKRNFIKEFDNVEYQDSLISQLPNFRGRNSKELLKLSPHKNSPPIILNNMLELTNDDNAITTSIFKHCCFCITSSTNKVMRLDLKNLILTNGGKVLEDGLNEIFDIETNEISKFYSNYKFGLVISMNGYCRSAKYLELLLLGWPVLSDKFITECCQKGRFLSKGVGSFLLPAGESIFLQSIKSCDIFQFLNNYQQGKSLSSQTRNNKFLTSYKVYKLQISSDPKRHILDFLLKCLGVDKIISSPTLQDMMTNFPKGFDKGMLVFINDEKEKLEFESISSNVKIIDWEWVVQCIINGMILEI